MQASTGAFGGAPAERCSARDTLRGEAAPRLHTGCPFRFARRLPAGVAPGCLDTLRGGTPHCHGPAWAVPLKIKGLCVAACGTCRVPLSPPVFSVLLGRWPVKARARKRASGAGIACLAPDLCGRGRFVNIFLAKPSGGPWGLAGSSRFLRLVRGRDDHYSGAWEEIRRACVGGSGHRGQSP